RTPRPGELPGASTSRGLLMRTLGDAGGSAPVLAYAESLSQAYRKSPTSVPPSLVDPSIVLGARRGDAAAFEDYRRHFENATIPTDRGLFLAGMGSFRDPALKTQALDYALKGPLRPQESTIIPYAMSENSLTIAAGRTGSGVYPDEIMKWTLD